jgi:NAD(P)H-hydrate epimerase
MTASLPRLPKREPASHKGDFGHVLVVAGSVGMTGAASLAAEAAVRAGAGLVTLLCPAGAWTVLASQLREVMVRPVGREGARGWTAALAAEVEAFADGVSARTGRAVLALGPGMGRGEGPSECAQRIALGIGLPLVLDADGIVAFEGRAEDLASRAGPKVLTPHPGEAARLIGAFEARDDAARREAALRLSKVTGAVVLLKGHRSVVAEGDRVEVNGTGNPGMATGGSGDVLTGLVAGLLAVGLGPFEAARLGAHVHGLAGDIAAAELGEISMAAGDVLRCVPAAFLRHQAEGGP